MREKLPWWVRALVVLQGKGPDRNGFWGNTTRGVSRRTIIISGEWWVWTNWWTPGESASHLEPSRDMDLA